MDRRTRSVKVRCDDKNQETQTDQIPTVWIAEGVAYCLRIAEREESPADGRAKYVLDGCGISPDAPIWLCDLCGHMWGRWRIGD